MLDRIDYNVERMASMSRLQKGVEGASGYQKKGTRGDHLLLILLVVGW